MHCCQVSVRLYEVSTCSCRYTGVMLTATNWFNHTYMQRLCHSRFSVTELRSENFSIRFCEKILAYGMWQQYLTKCNKKCVYMRTWSCCILSFGWFPGIWILYADVWELSHLRKWCKPDCLHHLWSWNSVPKRQHIKFRCQGITHKKVYNSEHGQSLRITFTWPYCLDMLIVRINAIGERVQPPGNLALQEEILLLDCYMMAKSRKYVILLSKGLHDWRESRWLKIFVIGINATCSCLYSGIHIITKEFHGTESLYLNSIRCWPLCPQGCLANCSLNCPTASLTFGRIVGYFRPLVGTAHKFPVWGVHQIS